MGREQGSTITRDQAVFLAGGLTADINDTQRHINYVLGMGKDQRGYSTPQEREIIRKLQKEKDQKIIDLLILRRKSGNAVNLSVEIETYPGEEVHAFSMNPVRLYVPSDINPLEQYYVKFELSGIRRPGVATDSKQAHELLGKTVDTESDAVSYLNRTTIELIRIRDMRIALTQAGENEKTNAYEAVVEDLNQLSADLVAGRLFTLDARDKVPQGFDIDFYPDYEHNETVTKIVKLSSGTQRPDDIYLFRVPAKNIVNSLNKATQNLS